MADRPIDAFAEELVRETGVLILPGTLFGDTGNRFRVGYGRTNLPAALERFERYAERTLR
jgi:aspartate/methionine/tyrosine aminotransferase